MITYLINSTLCLLVLLAVYYLFLEKESIHRFKRFFLLFSLAFGLGVCLLRFEIKPAPVNLSVIENTISRHATSRGDDINLAPGKGNSLTNVDYIATVAITIYTLGALLMLIRFMLSMIRIISQIIKCPKVKSAGHTIVLLKGGVIAHSFLNYIFLNEEDYLTDKIDDKVILHELSHVKQKHTIDIILMELLMIIYWFNPVFYYYKKAIQVNHEFLADESTVKACGDLSGYQRLLLQISGVKTIPLANNLNYSITKKRLNMMKTKTSKSIAALKGFALLPLLALLVVLFSNMAPALQANMQYVLVGNESFTNLPKFELDLYKGNKDFKKADNLIWLSISTTSIHVLGSGEYTYSSKSATTRGPLKFGGSVKSGGNDVAITDGSVIVKMDEQNIAVNYNLILKNGAKVTGQYNGKYQSADWRHR